MTRQDKARGREALTAATGPTAACVPIEHFDHLASHEQAHVAACAHCEAEISLWQQFEANEPSADEGAAVQWIAAEVARRRTAGSATPARAPRVGWFSGRAVAGLAAALLMMAAIGYSVVDREPSIRTTQPGPGIYRGSQIRVAQPVGDVSRPPEALQWVPVSGAARYDVVIHEIDGTTMWSGSSTAPAVTLPSSVSSQFAPGRSMTWEVTARDSSGVAIASSGTQRFRVLPRS